MDLLSLAIITGGLLLYSIVSGRLSGTILTAPFARLYGRMASSMGECEEIQPVKEMPLREGLLSNNNN
jgi:hypothetical protein